MPDSGHNGNASPVLSLRDEKSISCSTWGVLGLWVLDSGHRGNVSPVSFPYGTTLSTLELNNLLLDLESFGIWCLESKHCGNVSPVSFFYGTTLSTLEVSLLLYVLGFSCWIPDTVETLLRSHPLTGRLCRPLKSIFCSWDFGAGLKTLWKQFSGLMPTGRLCRFLSSIVCSSERVLGFWFGTQDTVRTLLRFHSVTGRFCRPLRSIFC